MAREAALALLVLTLAFAFVATSQAAYSDVGIDAIDFAADFLGDVGTRITGFVHMQTPAMEPAGIIAICGQACTSGDCTLLGDPFCTWGLPGPGWESIGDQCYDQFFSTCSALSEPLCGGEKMGGPLSMASPAGYCYWDAVEYWGPPACHSCAEIIPFPPEECESSSGGECTYFESPESGPVCVALIDPCEEEPPPEGFDFGDAPDSTNHPGFAMTAYPIGPVTAAFPTVWDPGLPAPYGPCHEYFWALLGTEISLENDADLLPDQDGITNIDPPGDSPDWDSTSLPYGMDDGLSNVPLYPGNNILFLPHCQPTSIPVEITIFKPDGFDADWDAYLNIWIDYDRDGEFGNNTIGDTVFCHQPNDTPEWVVQNLIVQHINIGETGPPAPFVVNPIFTGYVPEPSDVWMRVELTPVPVSYPDSSVNSGYCYEDGEVEDYYVEIIEEEGPTICECDSCSDCETKLGNVACDIVQLNTSIADDVGTCINWPAHNKIFDCMGNTIDGDDDLISSSNNHGIWVEGWDNNIIRNCIITDFYIGVQLHDAADNNTLINNTMTSNEFGIYLSTSSSYNDILDNTLSSNIGNGEAIPYHRGTGAYIWNAANYNTLSGNNISSNSDSGIVLSAAVQFTDVYNNFITSNDVYGIRMRETNNSLTRASNNSVWNNYIDNDNNVYDNGTNDWNTTYNCAGPANIVGASCMGGNYWSDYTGLDDGSNGTYPWNISGDGIGDTNLPYQGTTSIQNGGDYLPLIGLTTCYCNSCNDCNTKLNNVSCDIVQLNTSIWDYSGTCINWPANNKIFDCDGNTIDGDYTAASPGINILNKQNNTVRNCTITEFDMGVYLGGDYNNFIDNTVFLNNLTGFWVSGASNNSFTGNNVSSNLNVGIFVLGNSDNNTFTENTINSNGQGAAGGISFVHATSNNNTLNYNEICYNNWTDIADADANSGGNNTCDTVFSWNDQGTTGCTYPCPLLSPTRDWPMYLRTPDHIAYTTDSGPQNNNTRWTYDTNVPVYTSPVVLDGVVYFTSNKTLYALNANTGAKIWNITKGHSFAATPAVADGMVYVGGSSFSAIFYGFNATDGTTEWFVWDTGYHYAGASVYNGVVYETTLAPSMVSARLFALNGTDGTELWNVSIGPLFNGLYSSPAVANGMVYVGGFTSNKIHAFNATTGASIWNFTTGGTTGSSPAVVNGIVYVGSDDGTVYAINASTNASIWNYSSGSTFGYNSPAVAHGMVYIGAGNNKFYALNATTGTEIWNYTAGSWIADSPAVADEVVYFGSNDNKFYALDAFSGAHIWNYTTGSSVSSSPAVVDGIAYVGSDKLYAFGPPIPEGNLTASLIYPTTAINVSQNRFFNFTAQVSCEGGVCNNVTATLDPAATHCTTSPCVASSSLIKSVDSVAPTPEPNFPNTIDACMDGTSGTYMNDESIENITLTDLNGSTFTAGDTVQVDMWVYCWSAGASDNINFVYANNTSSPVPWKVASFVDPCPGGGFQRVSQNIILDNIGGTHAFRGIIQYNGATNVICGAGGWDDNDDVTFLVSGPAAPTSKGVVPMNNGTPFWTSSQNPMYAANLSCLEDMTDGDSCNVTWLVNATGAINSTWEFFATFNSSPGVSTPKVNITIREPDVTPPGILTNLNETAVGQTWIHWNWTNPTDPDFDHVEAWINGTFYANISTPFNYYNATGLSPSTLYEIQTRTADDSGNVNDTWVNDTATTLADNSGPTLTIHSPIAATYTNTSILINISASDPSGVDTIWFFNETGNETYTGPITKTYVDGFTYTLHAWANDTVGNEGYVNVTFTVNTSALDTTGPNVTIHSPLPQLYTYSSILINISATDPSGVDEIWFDNGTGNETYTGPIARTYLDGVHVLDAWANDTLGYETGVGVIFAVNTSIPTPPAPSGLGGASGISYRKRVIIWDNIRPAEEEEGYFYVVNDTLYAKLFPQDQILFKTFHDHRALVENHTMYIKAVKPSALRIRFSSAPFEEDFSVKAPSYVDVDGDGDDDIIVDVDRASDDYAEVVFVYLEEPYPAPPMEELWQPVKPEEEAPLPEVIERIVERIRYSPLLIALLSLVGVMLLVVWLLLPGVSSMPHAEHKKAAKEIKETKQRIEKLHKRLGNLEKGEVEKMLKEE